MVIIVAILGSFIGRFLIGGVLNFFLKPEEHDRPNPENWLGWVGAIVGMAIAIVMYKS